MSNTIIYLVGVKHSGKSTLGRLLSSHLKRPFLDTDAMIEDLDSAETAMRRPVRDIYADDGRERFMQLERTVVQLAASREDMPVVATGGGICDNSGAVEAMRPGLIVHLCDRVERIAHRILERGVPAFLTSRTPGEAEAELHALLTRRIDTYRTMADHTIDLEERSVSEALATLIEKIEEIHSGRK